MPYFPPTTARDLSADNIRNIWIYIERDREIASPTKKGKGETKTDEDKENIDIGVSEK